MIDDGQSGFIVNDVEEAAKAVERAKGLSRTGVRACFEHRFTVERMAQDYVAIYRSLPGVGENPPPHYLVGGEPAGSEIAYAQLSS